ncbi:MAG: hypothetical protein GY711_12840 [bacterium]|nr:hypothetical protein [bacterium]
MYTETRSLRLFALALTASLAAAPFAAADGGVFQESGGLVVVQIESTDATGDWVGTTTPSGYTFQSLYRWEGVDLFSTPGQGVLAYQIEIFQPGTYRLRIRNRHDDPDDTEENDVWTRMDGGTWFKTFSNGPGTVATWNWETQFDITGQPDASWSLGAGVHTLEFSARSHGFMMDRFHLALPGNPGSENANLPESTALLGDPFCVPVNNSTGMPGEMRVLGSSHAVNMDISLEASQMPMNQFGFFLTSQVAQGGFTPPGSAGRICLGTGIARFNGQVQNTGSSGTFGITVDTQNIPTTPPTAIVSGETWYFQAWFRDGGTSNFTRGVEVDFQ